MKRANHALHAAPAEYLHRSVGRSEFKRRQTDTAEHDNKARETEGRILCRAFGDGGILQNYHPNDASVEIGALRDLPNWIDDGPLGKLMS
ncbi:hypothetical protein [Bradyrhizobium sp. 150]|uniref:hypothetical protein n=1 Tax=Bradyrhizobium sp. 150 TaxID=2782625 RepID=UPI001FFAFC52|nr:hypothetical protein [Bradyrhizobium sp. 150]MCK1676396.1 hypothetical protein [Bradyrhizobium sp. 150]